MKRFFVWIMTLALAISSVGCSRMPVTDPTVAETQPTQTVCETTSRQETSKATTPKKKATKSTSPKKTTASMPTRPKPPQNVTRATLPEPTVTEETLPELEPTVVEQTLAEPTESEETLPEPEPTAEDTLPTEQPTTALEPVPFQEVVPCGDYFSMTYFSPTNSPNKIQCLFHEPVRQNTGKSYPLIIYLHGKGETLSATNWGSGKVFIESLMDMENAAEKFGAYTLVPVTPLGKNGWWTDTEFIFLKCLIDRLVRSYHIDAKRIYVTGISMGGYTTCRLLKEMPPDTFAAAVPLSGAYTMKDPVAVHNTAFRIYHSAADTVVDVSRSRDLYQQLVDSNHPNVEYFESEYGGHMSPLQTAYGDPYFYFWLFEQQLP
ncbi:MAG: prolyl oligopeptidase family serine peptidase [Oscillospiraceae bacterium]|nr:prolyl oligopeptidase family serine peptidase [Oscillospiraceae bacterium]